MLGPIGLDQARTKPVVVCAPRKVRRFRADKIVVKRDPVHPGRHIEFDLQGHSVTIHAARRQVSSGLGYGVDDPGAEHRKRVPPAGLDDAPSVKYTRRNVHSDQVHVSDEGRLDVQRSDQLLRCCQSLSRVGYNEQSFTS